MNKLRTEFDSPEASPGFLLWQVTNKWQAEQRKALAAFDLTHVQFVLLASLTWASDGAPLTQKQLSLQAKTDVMMTSQVVRTLEKKGLLSREIDPIDKRARVLQPTTNGETLVNRAVVAVEMVDRQFFASLGDTIGDFTAMMARLI